MRNDPLEALQNVVKQTGMGKTQFEACLNDQGLFDKVNAERSTPAWQDFQGQFRRRPSSSMAQGKPGVVAPVIFDQTLAPYLK